MVSWWQAALGAFGAILAAIIAGSFAVRNARKTPYETLKTLVDIAEKAEGHIWREDRVVLEAAVHREIQRIDRLNQARLGGFWSYWFERLKQSSALLDSILITSPGIKVGLSRGKSGQWSLRMLTPFSKTGFNYPLFGKPSESSAAGVSTGAASPAKSGPGLMAREHNDARDDTDGGGTAGRTRRQR
jgi:hypothetical protein